MKKFLSKPYRWAAIYSIILAGTFAFTLVDTFVLPKSITNVSVEAVPSKSSLTASEGSPSTTPVGETLAKSDTQSEAVITN